MTKQTDNAMAAQPRRRKGIISMTISQGETQARAMQWMHFLYSHASCAWTNHTIELYEHMIDTMEN